MNSRDPKLYLNRGVYWMQQGRKEKACSDIGKAKSMGLTVPDLEKLCR
ncbi:MAG: hypothetical protein HY958_01140 [Bacteroidia bacterium]|nr:hypothetical protein [Bacteroidia bacterium]